MKLTRRRLMELAGLTEQVLRGIKITFKVYSGPRMSAGNIKELFGSFVTIKSGPVPIGSKDECVIDLDVDALRSALESQQEYTTDEFQGKLEIYNKETYFQINTADLPQDVVADLTLPKYAHYVWRNKQITPTVDIQIADPSDGFESPMDYELPTAIQSIVGKFPTSVDPEDERAYDAAIDAYLKKIGKALLDVGKKVVPGMKKYAMEDGAFTFKLPALPDAQTEAKLKAAFRGAKEVTV